MSEPLNVPMTPSELKAITDDFTKPLTAVVAVSLHDLFSYSGGGLGSFLLTLLNNEVSEQITGCRAGLTNISYWVVNGEREEKTEGSWGNVYFEVTADIEPALIQGGEFAPPPGLLVHHGERNG